MSPFISGSGASLISAMIGNPGRRLDHLKSKRLELVCVCRAWARRDGHGRRLRCGVTHGGSFDGGLTNRIVAGQGNGLGIRRDGPPLFPNSCIVAPGLGGQADDSSAVSVVGAVAWRLLIRPLLRLSISPLYRFAGIANKTFERRAA
jgi:hypothetical protein